MGRPLVSAALRGGHLARLLGRASPGRYAAGAPATTPLPGDTMRSLLKATRLAVLAAALVGLSAASLHAQGKGNPHGHVPPGHAKKHVVTVDDAVVVTREVLIKHGYEIVRVETVHGTRVVYYRAGNRGRGRGKGPVETLIIRPSEERVVFERAPRSVLIDINVRLGL
jgi:hypothetical protein